MKIEIERIAENILLINGIEVKYEAEFRELTDQHHGAYIENGNVREEEVDVVGQVIEWIKFDPAQSQDIESAIIEWLEDGK